MLHVGILSKFYYLISSLLLLLELYLYLALSVYLFSPLSMTLLLPTLFYLPVPFSPPRLISYTFTLYNSRSRFCLASLLHLALILAFPYLLAVLVFSPISLSSLALFSFLLIYFSLTLSNSFRLLLL